MFAVTLAYVIVNTRQYHQDIKSNHLSAKQFELAREQYFNSNRRIEIETAIKASNILHLDLIKFKRSKVKHHESNIDYGYKLLHMINKWSEYLELSDPKVLKYLTHLDIHSIIITCNYLANYEVSHGDKRTVYGFLKVKRYLTDPK